MSLSQRNECSNPAIRITMRIDPEFCRVAIHLFNFTQLIVTPLHSIEDFAEVPRRADGIMR